MLQIWGRANSVNVQKVMWAVAELGLAHRRIDAGRGYGVNDEPWYLALNPNGTVPTIDDGGVVVWESNAIVRYLAARYGAGRLWPEDPAVRAAADMWMDWQQSTLNPPLHPLFWQLVRTPEKERDAAGIGEAEARCARAFAILDRHLEGRPYVAGDGLSMGDIPVGAMAHRWYALPVEHPEHPHLAAWYERLQARPGFREHVMLPLS